MNSSTKFDVTFAELTQLLMQPCKDDIQSFWECAFKGIENELESLFVKKIGPTHTNSIFRARWFGAPHDIEKVFENPGDALGPPPEAKKSGRMSSNNQHVFYGAEEKETAIAEIRPPVGSYVAVGRFNVIKDVILFDVTKFDELYKHSELKITTNQYEFLTCLPNRVSFPIFPDNTHEYLMTQSLVCYIKSKFKNIHGIRYDSSQTGYRGNNIMLFESNFSVEKIQNELKKVLKAFGLTYELGWSGIFYDNYFNTSARQKESRTVKNALKYFELGSLIPEWVIACSMGAKMRRLQRHYGNNAWWKKNIGRKYHERPQAYIYKSEHNKQYLLQRKVVFKAIRECARKQKMDYKLFPLDPKKMFTISFFE